MVKKREKFVIMAKSKDNINGKRHFIGEAQLPKKFYGLTTPSSKMSKKGQVAIFIILAIIIIVTAALIFLNYPRIRGILPRTSPQNPSAFMQTCIEEKIQETVDTLSLQGGSISPKHFIAFNGERIEYLCYTNKYYETCIMQQPLLKQHVEIEIEKEISEDSGECLNDLRDTFESRGYSVRVQSASPEVELLPKRIVTRYDAVLSINRNGETENTESIIVVVNNNLYELITITNSILNFEAALGDSETTTYMNYYHDLKVEKLKQGDGTTIYILTDRNNGNKFQFASKSLVFPPGLGLNEELQRTGGLEL